MSENQTNEKKSSGKVLKIIIITFAVLIFLGFILVMFSDDDEEEIAQDTSYETTEPDHQVSTENAVHTSEKKEDIISDGTEYGDPNTSWTVMLYLCGTDLESKYGFASDNLEEICSVNKGSNVNFVIQAGGTKKWKTDEISKDKITRLHVENGELTVDETCPSSSMGESDTLKDFIKWGFAKYPADRYMLVLWDHGGGSLFGVCNDELYDDDSLSLKELETALVGARAPFEVVGFDACLMSSLEAAEVLQGYAHYMVASEETEPGTGWDYAKWLNYLSGNGGCSGKELGKNIVDSYMDKCADIDQDNMATLSVCDLTKLPALSAAFRNYSGELVLSTQNESDFQTVVQRASKAESYGESSGDDGTFDMVDLGDLMNHTGGILTGNSDAVLKALNDVVVYESHGKYRSRANGLSVFYPKYIDNDIYQAYEEITDNTAYLEYASIMNDDWDEEAWENAWLDAFNEYIGEEESHGGFFDSFFGFDDAEDVDIFQNLHPVQSAGEKIKFEQFLDDDNILNLNITSGLGLVKDVRFDIMYDEDGENCIYLGCDTDLNADYEKGEFSDNFRGTWITIGGEYVCAEVIDSTDDYDLYIIPAVVNGEDTYIRAVYEFDNEAFRVLGTYDGSDSDTGLSGRNIHALKPGDRIEFIFYLSNIMEDEDTDPEEFIMGSIVWSNDTEMTDEDLGDGQYYYMFEIEDIFGNITYCDPVIMEIEDGEMYAYEIE